MRRQHFSGQIEPIFLCFGRIILKLNSYCFNLKLQQASNSFLKKWIDRCIQNLKSNKVAVISLEIHIQNLDLYPSIHPCAKQLPKKEPNMELMYFQSGRLQPSLSSPPWSWRTDRPWWRHIGQGGQTIPQWSVFRESRFERKAELVLASKTPQTK